MSGGANVAVLDAQGKPIPLSQRGPASTWSMISFGFWLFLLSDIVIFSALFATYAVLSKSTAGGPSGSDIFDLRSVFIETCCLLASSFTCGLMLIAAERRRLQNFYMWAAVTWVLGACFIGLEVTEFSDFVARGFGPTHSAFLSAFFTLVGTHGCHVSSGLLWLLVMVAQVATLGLRTTVVRRLFCFSLFWHALDLVWIGVFTIVYLGSVHV
ncbi:MAG TPA: cytochrome o ubiquinol oxidase subunit III [Steroidobacteraceae bacterium]|nr:cytochrome o ubiquinol oxidase subunit III [Steroidobacteraceae bacterium]